MRRFRSGPVIIVVEVKLKRPPVYVFRSSTLSYHISQETRRAFDRKTMLKGYTYGNSRGRCTYSLDSDVYVHALWIFRTHPIRFIIDVESQRCASVCLFSGTAHQQHVALAIHNKSKQSSASRRPPETAGGSA